MGRAKRSYSHGANRSRGGSSSFSSRMSIGEINLFTGFFELQRRKAIGVSFIKKAAAEGNVKAKATLARVNQSRYLTTRANVEKRRPDREARAAKAVPKGFRRVARNDPISGELYVCDIPVPSSRDFTLVLDKIARRLYADAMLLAPDLEPWHIEFIQTGRLPDEDEADG